MFQRVVHSRRHSVAFACVMMCFQGMARTPFVQLEPLHPAWSQDDQSLLLKVNLINRGSSCDFYGGCLFAVVEGGDPDSRPIVTGAQLVDGWGSIFYGLKVFKSEFGMGSSMVSMEFDTLSYYPFTVSIPAASTNTLAVLILDRPDLTGHKSFAGGVWNVLLYWDGGYTYPSFLNTAPNGDELYLFGDASGNVLPSVSVSAAPSNVVYSYLNGQPTDIPTSEILRNFQSGSSNNPVLIGVDSRTLNGMAVTLSGGSVRIVPSAGLNSRDQFGVTVLSDGVEKRGIVYLEAQSALDVAEVPLLPPVVFLSMSALLGLTGCLRISKAMSSCRRLEVPGCRNVS